MANRLVGNRELAKVVPSHFRADLDLVERLAVVDTNDRTNHLRHDDHVSEVGLDGLWLLTIFQTLL